MLRQVFEIFDDYHETPPRLQSASDPLAGTST
jgi:hypothetical protein